MGGDDLPARPRRCAGDAVGRLAVIRAVAATAQLQLGAEQLRLVRADAAVGFELGEPLKTCLCDLVECVAQLDLTIVARRDAQRANERLEPEAAADQCDRDDAEGEEDDQVAFGERPPAVRSGIASAAASESAPRAPLSDVTVSSLRRKPRPRGLRSPSMAPCAKTHAKRIPTTIALTATTSTVSCCHRTA